MMGIPPPPGFVLDQDTGPPTPLIPRTPAPQTPAQAEKDKLDVGTAALTQQELRGKIEDQGNKREQKVQAQSNHAEYAKSVLSAIGEAHGNTSAWSTGLGSYLSPIPATQAHDLQANIDTVTANIGFDRLQAMRAESPTGGALGQVSDFENRMLQSSLTSLRQSQSEDQFKKHLDDVEFHYLNVLNTLDGKPPFKSLDEARKTWGPVVAAQTTSPPASGSPPSSGGGNPPGGGPDISQFNDQMHTMFNAGASTADILAYGKLHNLYPNADEIDLARKNHMDVRFVQPQGQPSVQEAPGFGRQLLDATKNDVAGIVQGAAMIPDALATGLGKAASIVPTAIGYGLDKIGADRAGTYLHGVAHGLANPITIGGTVEGIAPTPDTTSGKVARFASQMAGGAAAMPTSAVENVVGRFVGEAPKAPLPLRAYSGSTPQETAAALEAEGIPAARPIADPSKRASMAYLETTRGGHNIVQSSLAQTRQSIANKVAGLAGEGEAQTPGAAGEVIQSAGKRTLQNMKDAARKVYTQADQVSAKAPIKPTAALEKLDGYIEQMSRNPKTNAGVLSYLKDVRSDLASKGGKTVGDIRDIITGANDKISYQNLARTRAEGVMSEVSKALNADVARDLGSANPQALSLYNKADGIWREMSNLRQQVVKKLIGPADNPISGESAMNRVRAMMGNKGDLNRFKRVINMMNPEEQASFRASMWEGIGQKSADEPFSPATFVTQTRGMSVDALKTVFGEDGAKSIQNLRVASKGLREAQSSLNNSRSGLVNNFKDIVSTIFSLKKAGAGAVGFAVGGLPGAVVGTVGAEALERGANALSAKALMNPEVSQWIRKVATVKTASEARTLIKKLSGIGAGNAALQSELSPLRAMLAGLNDNVPRSGALAASPEQRPAQQQ